MELSRPSYGEVSSTPDYVVAKINMKNIEKLKVSSSLFREQTQRDVSPSYTGAPSFFNHSEAAKKARQVVTNFTTSYLSQYSQPHSPTGEQVSLSGIGDSDHLRTLQKRIVSKQVNQEQRKQILNNKERREQEDQIALKVEKALIRDITREEDTKQFIRAQNKRFNYLKTKEAMSA